MKRQQNRKYRKYRIQKRALEMLKSSNVQVNAVPEKSEVKLGREKETKRGVGRSNT